MTSRPLTGRAKSMYELITALRDQGGTVTIDLTKEGVDMKMSPGEVLDRFTIGCLKHARGLMDIDEFTELLRSACNEVKASDGGHDYAALVCDLLNLAHANAAIWRLEAAIRQGEEEKLGLEEVGRRALKMRNYNSIRVEKKNRINELLDSPERERKANHVSEKRNGSP